MNTEEKICVHGHCSCAATEGSDYCSPYCENVGDTTNNTVNEDHKDICDCGHPGCRG